MVVCVVVDSFKAFKGLNRLRLNTVNHGETQMNTTLRAQRGILIYIDRIVPRDDGAMVE